MEIIILYLLTVNMNLSIELSKSDQLLDLMIEKNQRMFKELETLGVSIDTASKYKKVMNEAPEEIKPC